MTTPYERTKAVIDTRELLLMLAAADEITVDGLVQSVALGLLRHYPVDVDLEVSAGVLPGIWAAPEHQRDSAAEAPEDRGVPVSVVPTKGGNPEKDDDQTASGS